MGDTFRSRRLIALVAAYVVAIQAVLLPLSAVAAAPVAASLCSAHATTNGTQLPADSQSGCPCAAGCGTLCCAHAVLADKPGAIVTRAQAFGPAPALHIRPLGLVRASVWRAQAPRGPPAA